MVYRCSTQTTVLIKQIKAAIPATLGGPKIAAARNCNANVFSSSDNESFLARTEKSKDSPVIPCHSDDCLPAVSAVQPPNGVAYE